MKIEFAISLLLASIIFILVGLSNIDVAFNRYHLAYWTGNKNIVLVKDRDVFGRESPIDEVYRIGYLQVFIGVILDVIAIILLLVKNKFIKKKVKL